MCRFTLVSIQSIMHFVLTLFDSSSAVGFGGWISRQTIWPSYLTTFTDNILRCGKICEYQGKCIAASYDKRGRTCYLHESFDPSMAVDTNGPYLFKIYQSTAATTGALSTCARDSQVVLPSAGTENNCYDIPKIGCPETYVRDDATDVCYRISTTKAIFDDASATCESEGGHLIRVDNWNTWGMIQNAIKLTPSDSSFVFLIDARQTEQLGTWKYSNGAVITWLNWAIGEPNGHSTENCIALYRHYDLHFVDISCSSVANFICQIE